MAEFVLKGNYVEFNSTVKHKISGTAIGTKFTPPYALYLYDYYFSKVNRCSPRFGLDILMILRTAGKKELDNFLNRVNSFYSNLRFTYEPSRESLNFLVVNVKIQQSKFVTDLYCKSTDGHLDLDSCHASHIKTDFLALSR